MIIRDYLRRNNPKAADYGGLDGAIIGIGRQGASPPVLVYSARKMIESLMKHGMTHAEAWGRYIRLSRLRKIKAEETPIIMDDLSTTIEKKDQDHESTDVFTKGKPHALTPRCCKGGRRPPPRKDLPRIQGCVRGVYRRSK